MADLSARSLWRIRLCPHGPQCSDQNCVHAHKLSELRPPIEAFGRHDQVWSEGVDRWYGQTLLPRQKQLLLDYCSDTPEYEIPLWVSGFLFYVHGQHLVRDVHLPWDYGLCEDLDVLCNIRRGPVPFDFMADLWPKLGERLAVLETEQE